MEVEGENIHSFGSFVCSVGCSIDGGGRRENNPKRFRNETETTNHMVNEGA